MLSSRRAASCKVYSGYVSAWCLFLVICFVAVPLRAEDAMSPRERLRAALQLADEGREGEGRLLLETLVQELQATEDADALVVLGRAYYYLDRDEAARETLRRALDLDPERSEAHFFLGLLHRHGGNVAEGIRSLEQAVRYDSDVYASWIELALSYSAAGRDEEAVAAYDRAIELAPQETLPYYNSAVLLLRMGRDDEALKRFLKALDFNPQDDRALYVAGVILKQQGREHEALEYFQRVLQLVPTDWNAMEHVIQIYQQIGASELRDAAILQLKALRESGAVPGLSESSFFVRDRFRHGEFTVLVLEFFEFEGPMARRYIFDVLDPQNTSVIQISLGGYSFTRAAAALSGFEFADELFHLDGYWPNGSHRLYGFFAPEPAYDEVREQVMLILEGGVDSNSGFDPGE